MTPPLTPQPDHPMETPTAAETTSTQLFGPTNASTYAWLPDRWGCLVSKGNLCLPLCGWTGISCNSQLAWCQMLVALAFVCNQMDNDEYKLVAPLVPLSTLKHPFSTPSRHSIPHLPMDSAPSTGTSSKTPGNHSLSSGSRRCPSE
ncbi:hypothetical protein DSO57_1003660 [Entomophthora muscae]|uniref:Uncharacterized protein n=1 Tax=Entomophthora muscae TaxID=34485 RepID=A0ACC2T853_9FUNG|nr:hypothetical protein DSO57_1003660 [Entomophthora muscae]